MGQGSSGAQLVPLALKPSCGCCRAASRGLWSHLQTWLGENTLLNSFTLLLGEFSSLWVSFPGGSEVKNPPAHAGDIGHLGLIPGSGRSLGRKWQPLQCSCLAKPMNGGACGLQSMGPQGVGHAWAVGLRTVVSGWLLAGAAPQLFAM